MTIYLGPLGNLQALPSIGRGLSVNLSQPSVVHQIAGARGGRVVDHIGAAKRTYSMGRDHLTADEVSILEGLYLGGYGPGPYVLINPWRRNLLTANQSTGTDVNADTTGFVALSGAVTSSTTAADRGSRSLAWAVTALNQQVMTGSFGGLTNATPASDTPVLPLVSYTAQVRGMLAASTGTLRVDLAWYTAQGASISQAAGTAVALSTSAFTTATVTATAPSTAALARLLVWNTAFGVATTIYLDSWQIEQAAAAGAWVVGTGVPRVAFTDDLTEAYPIFPNVNAAFTLIEL